MPQGSAGACSSAPQAHRQARAGGSKGKRPDGSWHVEAKGSCPASRPGSLQDAAPPQPLSTLNPLCPCRCSLWSQLGERAPCRAGGPGSALAPGSLPPRGDLSEQSRVRLDRLLCPFLERQWPMVTALLSLSPSPTSCGTPLLAHLGTAPRPSVPGTSHLPAQSYGRRPSTLHPKVGLPHHVLPSQNMAPEHRSIPVCPSCVMVGSQWCPKPPLARQDPMAPWDPCFPLKDLTPHTSVSKLLSFPLPFPLSNPHTGAVLGHLPSVHQHSHLCGQCQLQQQSRVVWEPMLRTAAVVSLPCCWAAARALGHREAAFNMQALSYLMPFSRERW